MSGLFAMTGSEVIAGDLYRLTGELEVGRMVLAPSVPAPEHHIRCIDERERIERPTRAAAAALLGEEALPRPAVRPAAPERVDVLRGLGRVARTSHLGRQPRLGQCVRRS